MVFQLREQQIRMRDQEIRAKEVDQRGEQSALIQDMARTIMQLANRNAPTHSTEGFRGFATQIQEIPNDSRKLQRFLLNFTSKLCVQKSK